MRQTAASRPVQICVRRKREGHRTSDAGRAASRRRRSERRQPRRIRLRPVERLRQQPHRASACRHLPLRIRPLVASVSASARPLPLRVAIATSALSGQPAFTLPTQRILPSRAAWYASVAFGFSSASARPESSATRDAASSSKYSTSTGLSRCATLRRSHSSRMRSWLVPDAVMIRRPATSRGAAIRAIGLAART